MRLHRFYVNKPLGEELVVESVGVEKEILHQWTHVFRYQSGDEVVLFSSFAKGTDFHYRISSISKGQALLALVSSSDNVSAKDITLAMALVKKDTFETVVRQATELGVSRIIPILAERSEKKNLNFERLSAISIEAAEQCGRGDVPEIAPISSIKEAFSLADGIQIVGSLHGKEKGVPTGPVTLWIGPEGGWTAEEETFFKENGAFLFKCTDTVLKADTAAVTLLAKIA